MKLRIGDKLSFYLRGHGEALIGEIELTEYHMSGGYSESINIEDNDIIEISNINDVFSEKYVVEEVDKDAEGKYSIYVNKGYKVLTIGIKEVEETLQKADYLAWRVLSKQI